MEAQPEMGPKANAMAAATIRALVGFMMTRPPRLAPWLTARRWVPPDPRRVSQRDVALVIVILLWSIDSTWRIMPTPIARESVARRIGGVTTGNAHLAFVRRETICDSVR
jgi:hypothetical protein